MDTKHVKNVSGITLEVIGYGVVEADGVIEVPMDFNNANFETVDAPERAPSKSEQRRVAELKKDDAPKA